MIVRRVASEGERRAMFFDMIQKIDDYFAVSLLLSDMGDTFPPSPECECFSI